MTYLFEGEILHRDSLGNHQLIRPSEINLMVASRGITPSERERDEIRNLGAEKSSWFRLICLIPIDDALRFKGFNQIKLSLLDSVEMISLR